MFTIVFWIVWILAAVWIFARGTPGPRDGMPYITEIKWEESTKWALAYHIFGFLWINAYLVGCTQFIIGASACMWYFECSTDTKGKGTVGKAITWLLIYHWGSVAFGSLIIGVS